MSDGPTLAQWEIRSRRVQALRMLRRRPAEPAVVEAALMLVQLAERARSHSDGPVTYLESCLKRGLALGNDGAMLNATVELLADLHNASGPQPSVVTPRPACSRATLPVSTHGEVIERRESRDQPAPWWNGAAWECSSLGR